jgi:hypothetical protein
VPLPLNFDDVGRCVSFAPDPLANPFNELDEMQSPIATRKEIRPDLDEIEEEVMDAIHEYRERQIYNDFKNYKNYYADANQ